MLNSIAADVAERVFVKAQTAVVFYLNAQVFCRCFLPEIETASDLEIAHEGGALWVGRVDIIVQINESKRITPWVGIKELQCSSDAVGALVIAGCAKRTEIIVNLQIRACTRAKRAQTQTHRYYESLGFQFYFTSTPSAL